MARAVGVVWPVNPLLHTCGPLSNWYRKFIEHLSAHLLFNFVKLCTELYCFLFHSLI